ncbi:Hypothetical protein SMAX5B_018014 [Scophthalmus maximus]|uniref:Uncharacterized protein n=1 Tax=Scophthalmus maximus TaxID=52904 RepID=A0A2U9CC35_SCOMX|nr:Hypothetical protein SMAX5B_018014 [Scophthalmus maximus]
MTSQGARGFVIAGSEDGGAVVPLRVCARLVYFHLYTLGKLIESGPVPSLGGAALDRQFEMCQGGNRRPGRRRDCVDANVGFGVS